MHNLHLKVKYGLLFEYMSTRMLAIGIRWYGHEQQRHVHISSFFSKAFVKSLFLDISAPYLETNSNVWCPSSFISFIYEIAFEGDRRVINIHILKSGYLKNSIKFYFFVYSYRKISCSQSVFGSNIEFSPLPKYYCKKITEYSCVRICQTVWTSRKS